MQSSWVLGAATKGAYDTAPATACKGSFQAFRPLGFSDLRELGGARAVASRCGRGERATRAWRAVGAPLGYRCSDLSGVAGRLLGGACRSVAPAAFVTTFSLFVVLVLAVGYQEAGAPLQRISSGYGVRALGLPAWVVGHLAFATLLTLCLGPITRVVSTRRRGTWESLRGESPTTPVDGGSR